MRATVPPGSTRCWNIAAALPLRRQRSAAVVEPPPRSGVRIQVRDADPRSSSARRDVISPPVVGTFRSTTTLVPNEACSIAVIATSGLSVSTPGRVGGRRQIERSRRVRSRSLVRQGHGPARVDPEKGPLVTCRQPPLLRSPLS